MNNIISNSEIKNQIVDDIQINNTQKTNFGAFTKEQWESIEILETNQHTLNVYKILSDLGEGSKSNITFETNFTSCGDKLYVGIIRKILQKIKYVDQTIVEPQVDKPTGGNNIITKFNKKSNGKKKQDKKPTKTELIIEETKKNKLILLMEDFIKTILNNKELNKNGFSSPIVEIRLATLMHYTNVLLKNSQYKLNYYELIMSIEKVINNLGSKIECSMIAKQDLEWNVTRLKQHCKFNILTLLNQYPKLILTCEYDNIFPTMSIKPYESQLNLMNEIRNNESGLFLYKAMIGSGKTSFVISLCKYIKSLKVSVDIGSKVSKIASTTLQVIFACSVDAVRLQIAKIAYNMGIPFGIASITEKGLKISNNNLYCKDPTKRVLIIADLVSTVEILKQSQDYILFLDEPTIGADQQNHPITMEVIKVVLLAPSKTILSSATLPSEHELEPIINKFKEQHHQANVVTINSKETFIGCEITNLDNNETLLPHNNCKTETELRFVIDKIKNSVFINRLYTGPILFRIIDRMEKNNIHNVDLNEYFKDVSLLSQFEIQKFVIQQLEFLADTHNDQLIKQICEPLKSDGDDGGNKCNQQQTTNDTLDDSDIWANEDEEDGQINGDEDESNNKYSKFKNLLTSDAHKYMGSALITVKNPIEFANYVQAKLFEKCTSATKIIKKYLYELNEYNDKLNKLESAKKTVKTYKKDQDNYDNKENEDNRAKELQRLLNSKPTINFPHNFIINTPAHVNEYCTSDKITDKKLLRFPDISQYPLDLNIPDWIYQLLFSGVGIYMPSKLSKSYTTFVLKLAAEAKLAFLISDYDISYGSNYPFSHVIITDDGAAEHSINTIFQLLGRAGRVGTSWVAYGHLESMTINRIVDYIRNNDQDYMTEEGINMNWALTKILNDIRLKSVKVSIHGIEKEAKIVQISKITQVDNSWRKESRVNQKNNNNTSNNTSNNDNNNRGNGGYNNYRQNDRYGGSQSSGQNKDGQYRGGRGSYRTGTFSGGKFDNYNKDNHDSPRNGGTNNTSTWNNFNRNNDGNKTGTGPTKTNSWSSNDGKKWGSFDRSNNNTNNNTNTNTNGGTGNKWEPRSYGGSYDRNKK